MLRKHIKADIGAEAFFSLMNAEKGRKSLKLLTRKEEVRLAKLIEKGDVKARDTFILSNFGLVVKEATWYARKNRPVSLLDLIQEGNIGLFRALERFDWRMGFKFSTYAVWWIRRYCEDFARTNTSQIPISKKNKNELVLYKKAKSNLRQALHREPVVEEVATEMKLASHKVSSLKRIDERRMISSEAFDQGFDGLVGSSLSENDEPELNRREYASSAIHSEFKKLFESNARNYQILCLLFDFTDKEKLTNGKIGQMFGLTLSQVSKIKRKAILALSQSERLSDVFKELIQKD